MPLEKLMRRGSDFLLHSSAIDRLSSKVDRLCGYIIIPGNRESEYLLFYRTVKFPWPSPLVLKATSEEIHFETLEKRIAAKTIEEMLSYLQKENILPADVKMKSIPGALQKLEAIAKGIYARNKTFLPSQLKPLMERITQSHPLKKDKEEALTLMFCRVINDMAISEAYNGKTIAIDAATQEEYLVKVKTNAGEYFFKSPFDFRVEKSLDGRQIKLLVIPHAPDTPGKNHRLGQGNYKMTSALQEFALPIFLKDRTRSSFYNRRVLLQTKPLKYDDSAREGLITQKELYAQLSLSDQLKMIDLPKELIAYEKPAYEEEALSSDSVPSGSSDRYGEFIDHGASSDYLYSLEMTQDWLNGDLAKAFSNKGPFFDFNSSAIKRLKPLDYLKIFTDVAFFLSKIHEKGFVHSDITPANILIKLNQSEGEIAPKNRSTVEGYF